MLGLRPAHPEHVVEEQVGGVVGGQALELEVGAVQHHLPQAADLGIHWNMALALVGLLVSYLMPVGYLYGRRLAMLPTWTWIFRAMRAR